MHTNISLSNRYVYFLIKRLDKQRHESEVRRPAAGSEEAKNIRTCSNEGRTLITQPHTQCHTHKNTQLCELVSSEVTEILLCFYWTDADLARLCITCKRICAPVQQLINNSMKRREWQAKDLEKLKLSPARLAYVRHAFLDCKKSLPSVFHDLSNLETLTYRGHFTLLTNSDIAAIGNCSQLRSLTLLSNCHELTDNTFTRKLHQTAHAGTVSLYQPDKYNSPSQLQQLEKSDPWGLQQANGHNRTS